MAKYDIKRDPAFLRRVQSKQDSRATVANSPVEIQLSESNCRCFVLYFGANNTFAVCLIPREVWHGGPEYAVAVTSTAIFGQDMIREITNAALGWLMLADASETRLVPYTQLKIEQMGYDLYATLYPDRVAGKEEIVIDYQGSHRLFKPRRAGNP